MQAVQASQSARFGRAHRVVEARHCIPISNLMFARHAASQVQTPHLCGCSWQSDGLEGDNKLRGPSPFFEPRRALPYAVPGAVMNTAEGTIVGTRIVLRAQSVKLNAAGADGEVVARSHVVERVDEQTNRV